MRKRTLLGSAVMVLMLSAQLAHGQQVVARVITQNDLRNLEIFMQTASAVSGALPDKATIMAALKMEKGAEPLVKAIENGTLVLTGATERESVWAYEKSALEKGGLILSNNGIEKLSAADVKKRLGK